MKLFGIIDEDFINYKKISMTLEFPFCTFKCNIDQGCEVCHNSHLSSFFPKDYSIESIIQRYMQNDMSESICMQGLEPFDSFDELFEFITKFRALSQDDIVIYTGYYENEIDDKLCMLKPFNNIIIKFGRFIPDQKPHYDKILGVYLSSDNQYGKILLESDYDGC